MTQPNPGEIAKLMVSRFIERRDAKAVQTDNGAYMPVRVNMRDTESELIPWRLSDVVDHVEGRQTYGHYVVSADGKCRCIVFDIDLRKKANAERGQEPILLDGVEIDPREVWAGPSTPAKRELATQLRVTAEGLALYAHKLIDTPVMVSYSGSKGMHTIVCLDPGTLAAEAREIVNVIFDSLDGVIVPDQGKNFFKFADKYPALSIEVFPKQDEIAAGGFGNLVRLPLGVNRKTGGKGFFLDLSSDIHSPKVDDALRALRDGSLR